MLCGCDVCGDDGNYDVCVRARVCVRVCVVQIGVNKDGWWDEIKLIHQSEARCPRLFGGLRY